MSYEPTIIYDADGYARLTAAGAARGVTVQWVTNSRNSGGTYEDDGISYPWRLVYHEIQGGANYSNITGHPYPPHVWYDPVNRILYQTVPLTRSAFALYQDANAPYRTNKARAIQVELAGYSEFVANEPIQWLDNIAEDVLIPIAQFVASKGGSLDILHLPNPWQVAGSAYQDAAQRFQPTEWAKWDGVCTHANVPMGDDHWDTGAMDIWRISQHAAYLIGQLLDPTTEKGSAMPALFIEDSNGTIWATFDSGYIRPATLPERDHWARVKNVETIKLDAGWTTFMLEKIIPSR